MLYYLSGILIPLVLAVFLSNILKPVVYFLERGRRPCKKAKEIGAYEDRCTMGLCHEDRVKPFRDCFFFCYMPRWLSVLLAILLCISFFVILGVCISLSIENFVAVSLQTFFFLHVLIIFLLNVFLLEY